MKKLFMLLLCVALVFSCTVIAFADPEQPAAQADYTILVDPAKTDEVYNAYKIFDVSYNQAKTAYTYTIANNSPWLSALMTPATPDPNFDSTADPLTVDGLTFTSNGSGYIVTFDDTLGDTARENMAKAIAAKLYAAIPQNLQPNATATGGSDNKATLNVSSSGDGYYFVTTSVGALCALDTADTTARVSDKNTVPRLDKKQSKDGSTFTDDPINASIGDDVYYQILVTDGDNTDKELTLVDTMTPGLDFVYNSGATDITVRIGSTIIPATETVEEGGVSVTKTNYTLTVDDTSPCGFTIVFTDAFMASKPTGTVIEIRYTAVVTDDAEIKGNTNGTAGAEAYNENTVTMTYSHQTDTDTVRLETYAIDVIKIDTDYNILDGAEFDLYDAQTGGNQIKLVLESTDQVTGIKTYRVAPDAQTSAKIEAGKVRITGLGQDTYWLEETAAPDGYNMLDERTDLQVGAANNLATLGDNYTTYVTGGKPVENRSGSTMPSTGGIGTYLFYGIGAILVVGAVVVLVSKKRMHAYSD